MRFLIFGGMGRLGRVLRDEIRSSGDSCTCLSSAADVVDIGIIGDAIHRFTPDVVINCAAVLSLQSENDKKLAWRTNVEGAFNLAFSCLNNRVRLVQISTDYVFDGHQGMYSEEDPPNPVNYYGVTKMNAECAVAAANPLALTLRAPFRHRGPWPHERAFVDQITSCRWSDEAAKDIVLAAKHDELVGVLHMGGPPRRIIEMAREVSPDIKGCTTSCFTQFPIPRDVSLDSSFWAKLRENLNV